MALTLMQIFKNVARVGGERPYLATLVRVKGFRIGRLKSDPRVRLRILAKTWSIESKNGRPVVGAYATNIDFLNERHVRVSCSCGDFWARWEYALARKGAAVIKYSNGDPPDSTNPKYIPGCCIAKGSIVATEDGSARIEDVRVGDRVLTLNGYCRVTDAGLTRRRTRVLELSFNDRTLRLTPDHLVLAVKPNAHAPAWYAAEQLELGDHLLSLTDAQPAAHVYKSVVSIQEGVADVYDLTVDQAEHFTAEGLVVHNCKHIIKLTDHAVRNDLLNPDFTLKE